MIKRPCSVCGITIVTETLAERYCGAACEALQARRDSHSHVPPGHPEYHPINDTQAARHRAALRKRGPIR